LHLPSFELINSSARSLGTKHNVKSVEKASRASFRPRELSETLTKRRPSPAHLALPTKKLKGEESETDANPKQARLLDEKKTELTASLATPFHAGAGG
jgi:hypothetical protein